MNLLVVPDPDITQTAEINAPDKPSRAVPGVVPVFTRAATLPPARAVVRPMVVGRELTTDFPIQDGKISRQHARLEPLGRGVAVVDLGSHNGTFVNGERVVGGPVGAPIGSVLRIGETLFCVVRDVTVYRSYPPRTAASMVGGPALDEVRSKLAAVARATTPLLIEGETGTGKEVAAAFLHALSGRPGELVAVNCAALPADLIESELFGHAKGSFSGSEGARRGLFRSADGGTLLLDEVGELPPVSQAKLLRALETSEIRPVGEDRGVRIDVRIVAATNRSLDAMVAAGAFRTDLYHRLAASRVVLPPLRDRLEDVPLLCEYFLAEAPMVIAPTAMEQLMLHDWPGNVRELRHAILTATTVARTAGLEAVSVEQLALLPKAPSVRPASPASAEDDVLRERISTALKLRDGNVAKVARDLDMARSVLYTTLNRLGVDPATYRKR